uniref:V-type proton ATPase subunit G n=1 Tax=Chromera velia CCMP2878 TaxID=1169474 RepID=A0A0G4H0L1_9ALVE|mmetsp:Transcript_38952/g.76571  ORF Transcript_38952/g.76571 Transcript_38952/m.76571 type:complete len:123 (-) Transcript_38952:1340-1708(-)|eukprot:Cvel_5517.t1-p1 / transcript=Cvel_5517.t1 / gene=Cvel_5517 / organism=Chromera_velia_CCMP2878 / gene_product=V-type proton ATPase subunit G, putative / transcript_product=V-type proton ATPase subunit G, putative / location=Cvel_scaffold258:72907-73272(+) / protein_length=122 / sequence_SO=supercontig / SO=protein_coding / is_pseudo=false
MKSNALIQQLLKAEEDAEAVVKKARDNRIKKLRDARTAADEELKHFRQKEDEAFNAEYKNKYGSTDVYQQELDAQTEKEVTEVKAQFAANSKKVVMWMVDRVLRVEHELPTIVCRALREQKV